MSLEEYNFHGRVTMIRVPHIEENSKDIHAVIELTEPKYVRTGSIWVPLKCKTLNLGNTFKVKIILTPIEFDSFVKDNGSTLKVKLNNKPPKKFTV